MAAFWLPTPSPASAGAASAHASASKSSRRFAIAEEVRQDPRRPCTPTQDIPPARPFPRESAARDNALLPGFRPGLESAQGGGRTAAEGADEGSVVGVRDLSRPVVELELLQRGERAIPILDQLEAASLELVELVEPVAGRRRLAQERARDEDDRKHGEHGPESKRERHTAAAPAAYRSASRRCSTASGHI